MESGCGTQFSLAGNLGAVARFHGADPEPKQIGAIRINYWVVV
jgi:hypothetical protein